MADIGGKLGLKAFGLFGDLPCLDISLIQVTQTLISFVQ